MKVGLHDLARSHISSHVEKVILSDSLWTHLSDPDQGGRLSAVLGVFVTSLPPVGPPPTWHPGQAAVWGWTVTHLVFWVLLYSVYAQ